MTQRDCFREYISMYGNGSAIELYEYAKDKGAPFKSVGRTKQLRSARKNLDWMVKEGEHIRIDWIYYKNKEGS